MTTTTFANGTRVSFRAGRATVSSSGTVTGTTTSGEGRGRKTFLIVKRDDGRELKVMPGAASAA